MYDLDALHKRQHRTERFAWDLFSWRSWLVIYGPAPPVEGEFATGLVGLGFEAPALGYENLLAFRITWIWRGRNRSLLGPERKPPRAWLGR